MIVWGIWWQDAFWFSTGPRTRKVKNIAASPHVVIGTEAADEAVILEAWWKKLRIALFGGSLLTSTIVNTAATSSPF